MLEGLRKLAGAIDRLLALRSGYVLLMGGEGRLAAAPPERFAHGWLGLMILSLLWGLVLVNLWGGTWRLFHDYDPLIMPAMATAGCFCLWAFRRGLVAIAELIGGRDATARAVAAAALVLAVGLCLARLRPDWHRGEFEIPWWLQPLRPQAKLYRVLLLMPIWGGWSMMIAGKFTRPGERTAPQVAAFARGCGALPAAGCMAVPLVVSMAYFHYLGVGYQVAIPASAIVTAIGAGVALCRLTGGLNRRALLATNVLTQMAFVMTFIAGQPT